VEAEAIVTAWLQRNQAPTHHPLSPWMLLMPPHFLPLFVPHLFTSPCSSTPPTTRPFFG
jgi:hypothetical protein